MSEPPPQVVPTAIKAASEVLASSDSFIEFNDRLFGPDGILNSHFTTEAEMLAFVESEGFRRILRAARTLSLLPPDSDDGWGSIRIPPPLREQLQSEAESLGMSLQTLSVMKLSRSVC